MIKDNYKRIRDCFSQEKIKEIILYRSTYDCNKLFLEKINPNHIGIVYGQKDMSIKKNKHKGKNHVMIAKVFFGDIALILSLKIKERFDGIFRYFNVNNFNVFEIYTFAYLVFIFLFVCFIFNVNPIIQYVKKCQ